MLEHDAIKLEKGDFSKKAKGKRQRAKGNGQWAMGNVKQCVTLLFAFCNFALLLTSAKHTKRIKIFVLLTHFVLYFLPLPLGCRFPKTECKYPDGHGYRRQSRHPSARRLPFR